jgi:VCBS repeat-containing protein
MRDGTGATATATVTVTVAPVNDPPAANDDYYTSVNLLVVSLPLTVSAPGVLGNDTDVDGDPVTAELVTGPAHGSVFSFNADGSFGYTALLSFTGTDSFTYRVWDGTVWSAPATVYINVTSSNRAPTATADTYTTPEDTALVADVPGVLGNDADPDGDTVTAVLDGTTTHGVLTLFPDGSFKYTPAADWSGTDSFTYHATDGSLNSGTVTVQITVTPVNDPPTLDPVPNQTAAEDAGPVTVSLAGITAGGGESQTLTVTATSGDPTLIPNPAVTYASPAAAGSLTFQSAPNANGTTTITVTVSDGVTTASRTFTVTVTPVNDPPAAADDPGTTPEETPVTVTVLGNDTDPDGDSLTVIAVGPAGHGTVTTDGITVTYTPDPDWYGTDSFTYTADDGNGGTATGTVSMTVTPVNDPPVSADDTYSTPEDTPLGVPGPTGLLGNDTDVDGDSMTVVFVSGPAHGLLVLRPDGGFDYTPFADWNGTDSFTYRADDGTTDGNLATVWITVTPVNDPPVATADTYTTGRDTPLTVSGPGVLANDTDTDGDLLTATLVDPPTHGTVALHADGSFVYTPDPGFTGADSFTYQAYDGTTGGNVVTVTLTVSPPPNLPPVALADVYTATEDTPLSTAAPGVLANDADPDGGTLTAELVTGTGHGTVTMSGDGSFTYTPDAGFAGTDTFTYRVSDGQDDSGVVTVTITVLPAVTDPTGVPDPTGGGDTDTDPTATDSGPGSPAPTPPPPAAPPGLPKVDVPAKGDAAPVPITAVPGTGPIAVLPPGNGGTGGAVLISTAAATDTGTATTAIPRPTTDTARIFASPSPVIDPAGSFAANPIEARPAVEPKAPALVTGPVVSPTFESPRPATVAITPASAPPTGPAVLPPTAELLTAVEVGLAGPETAAAAAAAETQEVAVAEAGVVTVVGLSAGYVLLNTRAVSWLLGALLARPVLRPFDPLDVIDAWEADPDGAAENDESLVSLVG